MRCCLVGEVGVGDASASAADLLLVDLEGVTVLHVERFRVVAGVDSGAVEEEAHAGEGLALTLAEGVHELLQLGGALDLEEDLVVVVGHLDVQVLGLRLRCVVLISVVGWGWGLVRHVVGVAREWFGGCC